jgi:uncharacterized sulfatase
MYDNGNRPAVEYRNIVDYLSEVGYEVGLAGKLHFKSSSRFTRVKGWTEDCNAANPSWSMDGARQFISKARADSKPFCLFLCSVNAHHPWTVGDPSRFPIEQMKLPDHMVDDPVTRACLAERGAEVEELDRQVGAVMEMLGSMELEQDTVLIFLSEQGTAMPNGKWSVYDYGSRAVALFRWPGKISAGAKTGAVAMYADMVPTLVELAGGAVPEGIDGLSFADVLRNRDSEGRRTHALIFGQQCLRQRAIRTRDYKLIWNPDSDRSNRVWHMMAVS